MWQIVANLEFVTGFAIDLQTRKPNISPRVKYAIESYSEQLSINIAKTMSQLFCEKRKLQNRHDK